MGFPRLKDLERYLYLRYNRKSLVDEFVDMHIAGQDYHLRLFGVFWKLEREVAVGASLAIETVLKQAENIAEGGDGKLGIRF